MIETKMNFEEDLIHLIHTCQTTSLAASSQYLCWDLTSNIREFQISKFGILFSIFTYSLAVLTHSYGFEHHLYTEGS